MEIWKNIDDYPDYQVSNLGNVKNIKTGKLLKGSVNYLGYPYVYLRKGGKPKIKTIHRLVAEHFIPNPENKPEIDHINTDRTDYRIENLKWVTRKENNNNPITLEHKRGKKHNTKPQLEKFINKCLKDENGFTSLYNYISKMHNELDLKKLLLFYLLKDYAEEDLVFYNSIVDNELIKKIN